MNEHPKYYITYMKFHADTIHDSANVIHKEKMMNERIKQLWEQAAKTTQGDSWEEQTKFMERYTELIVRECAKRVNYWESRQGEHAEDLLKHFGVTE